MKKRIVVRKCMLLAVIPAMMLASCSKNDDIRPGALEPGGNTPAQGESISFKVDIVPPSQMTTDAPQSRMTTDMQFNNNWEEGDQIGVFAVKHGEALAASDNFINNAKLTYSSSADGGKWTADATLQWPTDGSKLDFYAYYPYDVAAVDPTEISFTIKSNQSETTEGKSNYDLSNLLMAKADNLGDGFGKGQTVDLAMRHALATVQLSVKISDIDDSQRPDVYLNGCRTATVLDLSSQHATTVQPTTTPTTKKITMYPCPNDVDADSIVYRALVPAGTIASGTIMFSVERNGTFFSESDPLNAYFLLTESAVAKFTHSSSPYRKVSVSSTVRIADKFTDEELREITHLRLFGEMKSDDFSTINNRMTNITHVDLGEATVEDNTIPAKAFQDKNLLKEFVFPRDITTIGENAFYSCSGLTGNLNIPKGVTTIGKAAFYGCSGFNGNLNIPASVETIGMYAFYNCKGFTGDLNIPSSITKIAEYAFYGCSGFNGNLNISSNVKTIGMYAFYNCKGFTGDLNIPSSITKIAEYAFAKCSGFNGNLKISSNVKTIGMHAFEECSSFIGNLKIPSNVKTIGKSAFRECRGFDGNLDIPSGVTEISWGAFYNCNSLTGNLNIPSSVKIIGDWAFYNCRSFTGNLDIPLGVTEIGYAAFRECEGFDGHLNIPSSVITIKREAFSGCSRFNGNLNIPSNVTKIEMYTFYGCSRFTGNLIIPESVTEIGMSAFSGCSGFTGDLNIPEGVRTIEQRAFDECTNLTSLTIPTSVNMINIGAFTGINSLSVTCYVDLTKQQIDARPPFFDGNSITIYVPSASVDIYKETDGWKDFNIQPIPGT